MDVSIIIVNYNTNRLTQDCIDSVFDKTKGLEFEVIVVDNGSTDGSKEHFEKDDRIKYIYCIENMGFGRANNLGFKHAKGDYVFLLNSDTCLINNAILEFYYYMRSAPLNVGCLGCLMMDREGMPIHSYGEFPGVRYFMWRVLTCYGINLLFLLNKSHADKKNPMKVDYICGADMFIRREVIEKYGLFDPDFFLYFEETEMQYRYNVNGFVSQIIKSPQIMHLKGASHEKGKKGKRSLKVASIEMKSRFIYCSKTKSSFEEIIVSFIHLFLIPRILTYNALWSEKRNMISIILCNFANQFIR